jgi:ferredoxin
MSITVNGAKCPQDHRCPAIKVCPVDAISQEGHGLPKVDQDACIDCMACADYCPMGAFEQAL